MNKDLGRAQTIPGLQSKYMNRIRHQSQSFYTWQIYSPESSLVTPCNCKTEGSPGSTILNVWVVKCNLHSVFCPPKKVPTSKYEKLKKQKNGNLKWHLPNTHKTNWKLERSRTKGLRREGTPPVDSGGSPPAPLHLGVRVPGCHAGDRQALIGGQL